MAYGLDITDLIYANWEHDPDRDEDRWVDQGTLEDYEIDLDVAIDKNFELRSDHHIMTNGSLWYVDGTEFGGIVGKFETDPDNYQIIYSGRSFRGIQAKKIIEVAEGKNVASFSGAITAVTNKILEDYDLSDFFVCDNPILHEEDDMPPVIGKIDILSGTTVYDALTKIAGSINYSYLYEYNAKEQKCHMTPVMNQDWTDVIAYNRENTIKFKAALNQDITNHLICSGIDEKGKRRTIHLFLNEAGEVQPYANVEDPLKDEDYILDKSKKVLTGIKEIADYYDGQISLETNYELLTEEPADWNIFFGNYYTRKHNESFGNFETKEIEEGRHIQFEDYITIDSLKINQGEEATLIELTPGTDWYLYNPETITTISFHEDYRNWPVKIGEKEYTVNENAVVDIPTSEVPETIEIHSDAKVALYGYTSDILERNYDYWVLDPVTRSKTIEFAEPFGVGEYVSIATKSVGEDSYEPVTAVEVVDHVAADPQPPPDWENNYSYYFKRNWNQSKQEYDFSSYSSTTELDENNPEKIDVEPPDWAYNYGDYYYYFHTGEQGHQDKLVQYSGESKPVYIPLVSEPEDWKKNFSSYYRIGYEVTYKDKKGKEHKKNVTTVAKAKAVKGYKSHKQTHISVTKPKDKKYPKFVKNKYFSKTTVTEPPRFKIGNCYKPHTVIVIPDCEIGNCFKEVRHADPPPFSQVDEHGKGIFYRMVEDHYANLVRNGVDNLKNQTDSDTYDITIDDFDFNIGDVVGGEDPITKLNQPQKITNKIIKINRGVVYVDYEIGG